MAASKMPEYTLLRAGRLIDGNGSEPMENAVIVIRGNVIEEVAPAAAFENLENNERCQIIDAGGRTVMPGMIDCHVHLNSYSLDNDFNIRLFYLQTPPALKVLHGANNCRRALEAGFTTLRNMGMPGGEDISLREAINAGVVPGPRLLTSGPEISMTAGHGDLGYLNLPGLDPVDGPDNCRKAVRDRVRRGADFIKTHATGGLSSDGDKATWCNYTIGELRAIADEAHELDRKVAAHAQGTRGVKNAILAGIDTVEHGVFLDDECVELMLKHSVFMVPTLIIAAYIARRGPQLNAPESAIKKAQAALESHVISFKKAYLAGVKIAMGTDAANLCKIGNNAVELEVMVQAGMSEKDAIMSTTKLAAEALGIDDRVGTIAKGKLADILVVSGNPLEEINVLCRHENIELVIKDGKIAHSRMQ